MLQNVKAPFVSGGEKDFFCGSHPASDPSAADSNETKMECESQVGINLSRKRLKKFTDISIFILCIFLKMFQN